MGEKWLSAEGAAKRKRRKRKKSKEKAAKKKLRVHVRQTNPVVQLVDTAQWLGVFLFDSI